MGMPNRNITNESKSSLLVDRVVLVLICSDLIKSK